MEKKKSAGMGYLLKLAGKQKILLLFSAIFSVLSALCTFVPFIMVYNVLMFLFDGGVNTDAAIQYGVIAALAILGKFLFSIISGIFSHVGAFNTLYNVRATISRHIAKVNLGFFTGHTTGEIKKVVIEDVERIERFLAHQIPDITAALCAPIIMFVYMLTLSVPMALCLLIPVEYPFIRYVPIATVKSGSHVSDCATTCGQEANRFHFDSVCACSVPR